MKGEQVCTNCGTRFGGAFCNKCGQQVTHRITMAHISHDMVHAFTHADKGFFYMMLQLFKRPGIVAREYILEGKRKKYFLPFQYILIIGTIAAFVAVNSHFIEQTTTALSGDGQYSARQVAFMQKISAWQSKYYNIMILLQLPFYAWAGKLVFKRHGLNYAEHLTLQTLLTAQVTLMSMIVMLSVMITGRSGGSLLVFMALITAAFQIFAYMQFFREFSFKGFLKAALVNLVGLLFFAAFISIVMVIYGWATNAFG